MSEARRSHLIQFLELYHLAENVLQDVLCVPLVFIQLRSHTQNLATLPYIKFQIVVCA